MKVVWLHIVLAIALLAGALVGATAAPVYAQSSPFTVNVTGGIIGFNGGTDLFVGSLRVTSFEGKGSELVAKGELAGDILDGGRSVIGNVRREIAMPVTAIRASCTMLQLEFGQLNPTPGLDIALDSLITVTVSVQPNSPQALGKLLCNVSRLVEKNNPGSAIASQLNQVLCQLR